MINFNSIKLTGKEKAYFILYFFLISHAAIYSQDQNHIDSLELNYTSDNFKERDQLKILEELGSDHFDPEKRIAFSEELIQTARALDSLDYVFSGYLQKGNAYRDLGDYKKALVDYFNAAKIAIDNKSNRDLGSINITIADVYSEMGNHNNAIHYYHKAIDILKQEKDSSKLATALYNAGDEYVNIKKYDSALVYFNASSNLFKKRENLMGTAYNLGSIGMIHAEKGNYDLAKQNINKAINILEDLSIYSPIPEFLGYMSDIYKDHNDLKSAFRYSNRSLEIAKKYKLKKEIGDASLKMSELYELAGNLPESFKYYKNYISYRDSINNIESIRQIADMRTNFEIQKNEDKILFLEKEARINELLDKRNKNMTYAAVAAAFLILLLALGIYRRYHFMKKTNRIIQKETDKSEKLLLNILPKETAIELKQNGKVKAKKFDSVSVMFTDFIGFTKISDNLSPEELVRSVDFYFSNFDKIIKEHSLEKIKTIGDSYMCAGGLPFPDKNHVFNAIDSALSILNFIEKTNAKDDQNIARFNVRIGINTGPVVAGVVGTTKFAYDIWGDTVNVASRMESMCEPGKINISENTYHLIKDKYECDFRGEFTVKNRGIMKMYFVKGIKKREAIGISSEGNVKA